MSIDEYGFSRLEKASLDAYNNADVRIGSIERYFMEQRKDKWLFDKTIAVNYEEERITREARMMGIRMGLFIFVSGFGMLYLLWICLGNSSDGPGLFDYYAACYGDSICLPILVGALTAYCRKGISVGHHHKKCLSAAILGAFTGMTVQAEWLISETTVLNWSIPIKHHFNLAGWYHSLFFIFMMALICYLLVNAYYVMGVHKGAYSWEERIDIALFSFSGLLYLLLHFWDDYREFLLNRGGLLLVSAITALLLSAILQRVEDSMKNKMVAIGTIWAISGFCIAALRGIGIDTLALAGSLSMLFLVDEEWDDMKHFVVVSLSLSAGSYGAFAIISSDAELILRLGIFAILMLAVKMLDTRPLNENEGVTVFLIALYILFERYIPVSMIGTGIELLFTALVYIIFDREIKKFFAPVIKAEKQKNNETISANDLFNVKAKCYTKITAAILCLSILLCFWLIKIVELNNGAITRLEYKQNAEFDLIIVIAIALLVLGGITICSSKINANRNIKQALICVVLILELCVCCLIIFMIFRAICCVGRISLSVPKLVIFFCSLFSCTGAGLLVGHGFLTNTILLRGGKLSGFIYTIIIVMVFLCTLISVETTFALICDLSWTMVVNAVMAIVIFFFVLPLFLGLARSGLNDENNAVVPTSALGGVAQDGLSITLLLIFSAYLPNAYCSIVSFEVFDVDKLPGLIWGMITLLFTAFAPAVFCITNNKGHIERQSRAIKSEDDRKQWEILRKCMIRQSLITCFALLPYILIVIAGEFIKEFIARNPAVNSISEFSKYLWKKYIEFV